MSKIYVVEDDESIREMVVYTLKSSGFEVVGLESGDEVFPLLDKEIPALILLDIMLPGSDGIIILDKLKKTVKWRCIPIIMLTAKGSEIDRIKGLDLGADDYITKPFSVMEVVSRVKAVLRRSNLSVEVDEVLTLGDIFLNRIKRTVYSKNEKLSLTYKEFELLQYMMINEGVVLSRERILNHVWGFEYDGESRTVDIHINQLRQKLGNAGKEIQTVRNIGYKIGV